MSEARRDAGLQAAAERLRGAGGNLLMDRLRALLNAVEQQEQRELKAASSAVAQTTERAQRLALIGSLVVVALLLIAFWAVHRNLRIRQQLAGAAQAGEARLGRCCRPFRITSMRWTTDSRYPAWPRERLAGRPSPRPSNPCCTTCSSSTKTAVCGRTRCEVQTRRTFEVRLMPTGLGDHGDCTGHQRAAAQP